MHLRLALIGASAICMAGTAYGFETPSRGPEATTRTIEEDTTTVFLRLGFGHDNNVQLAPDLPLFFIGDSDAAFVETSVLAYRWTQLSPSTRLGFSGLFAGRIHEDVFGGEVPGDSSTDYDNLTVHAKVFLETTMALGGGTLVLVPSLGFRHEDGRNVEALGLDSLQFALDGRYEIAPGSAVLFGLFLTDDDYGVEFTGIPTRDRDGNYSEVYVGFEQNTPIGRVNVGLASQDNDAGSDWTWDGHEVRASVTWSPMPGMNAAVFATHSDRDYNLGFTDLTPAGRDDLTARRVGARVSYRLGDNRSIDGYVRHLDVDANDPSFSLDQTEFGVGFTMRFP